MTRWREVSKQTVVRDAWGLRAVCRLWKELPKMWGVGAASTQGGSGPTRYISEKDAAFTNDINLEEGRCGKKQAGFTGLWPQFNED